MGSPTVARRSPVNGRLDVKGSYAGLRTAGVFETPQQGPMLVLPDKTAAAIGQILDMHLHNRCAEHASAQASMPTLPPLSTGSKGGCRD